MKSREEQREERRRYEADVSYEVWRNGGNPDRINYERVEDAYYNDVPSESTARREIERQRPRPHAEEQQDYPDSEKPE